MSLSVPIPDGVYQIFNVAFSNQDADLVYPGGPTGYIGGWQNNTESQRMQWQVANVVDMALAGQVSIWNTEVQTFASAALPPYPAPNTAVVGDPSSSVTWTVGVPPNLGGTELYAITLLNTNYVWTLGDGSNGAPITLELSTGEPQPNQLWTFVPLD